MKTNWIVSLVVAITLCGCAAHLPVKGTLLAGSNEKREIDLQLDPYQTVGILETEAIRNPDRGTFVRAVIPDILIGGEFAPGRVRWNAWAVDKDGTEAFGQVIWSSVERGRFYGLAIFDGSLTNDARVLMLSTTVDFAYDFLSDKELSLEGKKFREEPEYRKDFVRKNGTEVGMLARMDGNNVVAMVKQWNGYRTPEGMLWSVLGWKEVEQIAAINPQYSWTEKLGGTMHGALVMNPTGIIVGAAFDLLGTTTTPTKGWDFNSQLPSRRSMAVVIDYISRLKQRSLDEYLERSTTFSRRSLP